MIRVSTATPHCVIRGERFFTTGEAGEYLGISRDRFRRLSKKHGLSEGVGYYINHAGGHVNYVWTITQLDGLARAAGLLSPKENDHG